MFATFPELLFLAPIAALLMRVAAALVLGYGAWVHVRSSQSLLLGLAVIEGALAIALFLGAWTQPAALAASAVVALWLLCKRARPFPLSTVLLALAITLSLLVTGPGPFAFDLPF